MNLIFLLNDENDENEEKNKTFSQPIKYVRQLKQVFFHIIVLSSIKYLLSLQRV